MEEKHCHPDRRLLSQQQWKDLLFPPAPQKTRVPQVRVSNLGASCKIPSSGIGFGLGVDFAGFEGQEIAAPSIGERGKDNARCFWARRDCGVDMFQGFR
ncbi:MAG: hypothetical protein ACYCPD_06995, partial [Acidobacteriaceae bacterium]